MRKRRRHIDIDPRQPVLPQLNEALPHSHHCHQCRHMWQCEDPACTRGLSKLCDGCRKDAGLDPYLSPNRRPADVDHEATGTLLP